MSEDISDPKNPIYPKVFKDGIDNRIKMMLENGDIVELEE